LITTDVGEGKQGEDSTAENYDAKPASKEKYHDARSAWQCMHQAA
jgi:hypothetical protein